MPGPQHTDVLVDERTLLVHAYLDDELDIANAASIEKRIAEDPALRAEADGVLALRTAMREKFSRPSVPAHLQSRIETAVSAPWYNAQPSWRALAASVVAAIALTSGLMLALRPNPAGEQTIQAAVDSHLRALMADQPIMVASSDRHTVKPWFNGKIAQSPAVVDLADSGFPLVGGRIDVVAASPVATVVYKRRLHTISVIAIPDPEKPTPISIRPSIKGYNIVAWRDGRTEFVAVSDLNTRELETFAQSFQQGANSPGNNQPR